MPLSSDALLVQVCSQDRHLYGCQVLHARTHSWPESVEEGGVSGGGRGLELWMLGCLGGEAVEFWRSPSGFGDLERRER